MEVILKTSQENAMKINWRAESGKRRAESDEQDEVQDARTDEVDALETQMSEVIMVSVVSVADG
eukprot:CAMPEP_0183717038 /NCGR_PEP_ID=MMETSP0737-20130205/10751_1 /TAXON_ID=385413 /ORGANISM="Thalassiosira miniscula, Strain CCMP1093" /LENGTH=63 /DNA_ID=CAMNT_0025946395 /DNA_START=867 /DNA_END=1058 /DNA_ORIENTATION=-